MIPDWLALPATILCALFLTIIALFAVGAW